MADDDRRRTLIRAAGLCAAGLGTALLLLPLAARTTAAVGVLAVGAALLIGVGGAWLARVLRANPDRRAARELEALLAPAFDDSYTLVLLPRLPIRGRGLTGLLVGPAGIRVLTVRRWEGRYRVRGRAWEFDARGRRGWIACRTNPGFEAASLADGVGRWAETAGLGQVPVTPAVAFPRAFSHLVLEEPAEEVVTVDNVPWWANSIGRVQRYDPARAVRFVEAVLEAGEELATRGVGSTEPGPHAVARRP
jgi:hypothetical protein